MTATAKHRTAAAPADRRPVRQVLLTAPRPVWVLVVGVFLNRAGAYFATFLTLFLKQVGFSLHQLPAVLLLVGVATPLGSMFGGWLSDRFTRKISLVTTTGSSACGLGILALSHGHAMALIGVLIAALSAQSYLPAASALLVDYSDEADRVPIFALFRLLLNLGSATGSLMAILIVPHGLHKLFLVSTCSSLVFVMVLIVGLPASRRHDAKTAVAGRALAEPAVRAIPWRMIGFLTGTLLITLVYIQYASTVSLAVTHRHVASSYASLLMMNAILVICIELPLSAWTRKLPWHKPVLLGTALMASGIALSGAAAPLWLVLVGVLLWTVGEILFSPVVASAVASLAPNGRTGRYQGYLTTVQAAGFALGPALGAFVYAGHSSVLWGGCLLVGAVAAGAYAYAGRPSVRPVDERAQADEVLGQADEVLGQAVVGEVVVGEVVPQPTAGGAVAATQVVSTDG